MNHPAETQAPLPGRLNVSAGGGPVALLSALFSAALLTACGPLGTGTEVDAPPMPAAPQASFGTEQPTREVREIVDWVAASRDNQSLPFAVLDKLHAKVYVFDPQARLKGATPVLLGTAPGDDTVPGIGTRRIADIQPHERTTPAGRFVAEAGFNTQGEDIIWVDYDAAVSMHRVRATKPEERRLERLATPTVADNRISYGCINVPAKFYDEVVSPAFRARGIVYVLPETRPLRAVFRDYDRALRQREAAAGGVAQAGGGKR